MRRLCVRADPALGVPLSSTHFMALCEGTEAPPNPECSPHVGMASVSRSSFCMGDPDMAGAPFVCELGAVECRPGVAVEMDWAHALWELHGAFGSRALQGLLAELFPWSLPAEEDCTFWQSALDQADATLGPGASLAFAAVGESRGVAQ